MNIPRILLFLLFTAGTACAQAQDNATPPAATEPAQTEMQKWIATTDAQWQAAFKRDVADVHETELVKVKLQYLTSLETAISKASGASDLDGALALRNEQKRFADTKDFPEQDDAADAASVKQVRAPIRTQLARLEKDRATHAKALHAKYDQGARAGAGAAHAAPASRRCAAREEQARGSRRRVAGRYSRGSGTGGGG